MSKSDLVVERATLIADLAAQAEDSGARLNYGWRFKGLDGRGSLARFHVDGDERVVPSARLIGADGANSKVAASAGWPRHRSLPLLQAVVELPDGMESDVTRVWFRPQDTPYFYWLIPESPSRGVLGVIGKDTREMRDRLAAFIDSQGLAVRSFQAARVPQYERWTPIHRRVGDTDVYLVGDAVGHVKVSTVGGLVTGFRGAQAVVESIVSPGSKKAMSHLKRELTLHLLVRKALEGFSQEDYNIVLDGLDERGAGSLSNYDRDDAARIIWSFSKTRPRVVLHALRSLLRGVRAIP